jgi:hypothetical protein
MEMISFRPELQLNSGLHYLQEDHPHVIGANIKEWLIESGVGSCPKQKLTLYIFPLMSAVLPIRKLSKIIHLRPAALPA